MHAVQMMKIDEGIVSRKNEEECSSISTVTEHSKTKTTGRDTPDKEGKTGVVLHDEIK